MSDDAMQWCPQGCADREVHSRCRTGEDARTVVAWVKANGGEARYEPYGYPWHKRIAVRIRDGWAYCLPGQWVVKGDEWFFIHPGDSQCGCETREFTVADSRPGVSS